MTWDIPPFLAQKYAIHLPPPGLRHTQRNPLRTLVRKRSRPSGRPRGTSPQKDSCDHSGSSVQKNRRTSGLHHPTFSGTIILHPWITETCAQQIGIFMHSPTLPSRSMEVSPFYHHLLRCFSHEKIHPITREISYISTRTLSPHPISAAAAAVDNLPWSAPSP